MSELLAQAFAKAQTLPEPEQNSLARYIIELIDDEAWWDAQFARSEDLLARLSAQAHESYLNDQVEDFDPDNDSDDPDRA
ncbi:MAG: hypothetical protein KC519_17885 [Anaerolineae bacterium]|nr:hypothetical protein [Anaerolineae bacterium]